MRVIEMTYYLLKIKSDNKDTIKAIKKDIEDTFYIGSLETEIEIIKTLE